MEKHVHKQDLIYGADFWQDCGSYLQIDAQDRTKIVHSAEKDAANTALSLTFGDMAKKLFNIPDVSSIIQIEVTVTIHNMDIYRNAVIGIIVPASDNVQSLVNRGFTDYNDAPYYALHLDEGRRKSWHNSNWGHFAKTKMFAGNKVTFGFDISKNMLFGYNDDKDFGIIFQDIETNVNNEKYKAFRSFDIQDYQFAIQINGKHQSFSIDKIAVRYMEQKISDDGTYNPLFHFNCHNLRTDNEQDLKTMVDNVLHQGVTGDHGHDHDQMFVYDNVELFKSSSITSPKSDTRDNCVDGQIFKQSNNDDNINDNTSNDIDCPKRKQIIVWFGQNIDVAYNYGDKKTAPGDVARCHVTYTDDEVLTWIEQNIAPEIDGFTVKTSLGFWKGEKKSTTIVQIVVNADKMDTILQKSINIGQEYATKYNQQVVLETVGDHDVSNVLVLKPQGKNSCE